MSGTMESALIRKIEAIIGELEKRADVECEVTGSVWVNGREFTRREWDNIVMQTDVDEAVEFIMNRIYGVEVD